MVNALMAAKVKRTGGRWCVAHDRTGAVLVRKGRRVCFSTRGAAAKDALDTRRRIMGR